MKTLRGTESLVAVVYIRTEYSRSVYIGARKVDREN